MRSPPARPFASSAQVALLQPRNRQIGVFHGFLDGESDRVLAYPDQHGFGRNAQ
jgi:hypothetical protein